MAITLVTYQDMIEHLLAVHFGGAVDRNVRLMKTAVRQGWRQLNEIHDWRYYKREFLFQLNVPVEGGTGKTLVYDHTGGASERLVTITGTTFPAWLSTTPRHGRLEIAGEVYNVERYLSSTTCTLDSVQNPGDDVSSTTDWQLYRNTYPLPDDFGGMWELHQKDDPWGQAYIEPDEWHAFERSYGNMGEPFYWTLMNDPARLGGWVIRTIGYPTSADTLTLIYRARGNDPTLSGLETKTSVGTIAVTAGNTTVTGTTTTFDASMVGAILRITGDSSAPTGPEGDNPFAEQHQIRAVTTATSLELWTPAVTAVSGKKYTISSLLDVEPGAMLNALHRSCEHQLALLGQDEKKSSAKWSFFVNAVNLAKQHDSKIKMMRVSGQSYGPSISLLGDVSGYDFGDTVTVP